MAVVAEGIKAVVDFRARTKRLPSDERRRFTIIRLRAHHFNRPLLLAFKMPHRALAPA